MAFVNFILVGVLIFLYVIMAFSLGLAGKPHKNVILENTLPTDKLTAPETLAIINSYKRALWKTAAVSSLLSLTILIFTYDSLIMTFFWLLMLVPLTVFYGIEIRYIRKMALLKAQLGWRIPVEPIMVDTRLTVAKNKQMVGFAWLIPPLIVTLGFTIWQSSTDFDDNLMMNLVAIFSWLLAVGCWYSVKRLPVMAPTDDSDLNRRYNDLTKRSWSQVAVGISYGFVAIFLLSIIGPQLSGLGAILLAIVSFLTIFGSIFLCIAHLLGLRKKQDALLAQTEDFRYAGEDRYWRFGVYINPADHRLMVADRIGLNISMNLGRPIGKVLVGLIGLLVLGAMVMTLLPTYLLDFSHEPFTGEINNGDVYLSAPLSGSSQIPIEAIQKAELIDKISDRVASIHRTNGYGGAYYQIGRFTVDGKQAVFYLDNRSQPLLHLVTREKDYYFTFKEPAQTKALFTTLQTKLKELPASSSEK